MSHQISSGKRKNELISPGDPPLTNEEGQPILVENFRDASEDIPYVFSGTHFHPRRLGSRSSTLPPAPLESVDRALRLILFLRSTGSVSVKEAAEHLHTGTSTAHRLLSTLTRRGFTTQDGERRYRIGPELLSNPPSAITDLKLRETGRHPLLDLYAEIEEAVYLVALHKEKTHFLDGIEKPGTFRTGISLRDELPAFSSAGGQAMLAHLSNQEIEELYPAGLSPGPTKKNYPMKMLKRRMTDIRRVGYAVSIQDSARGVTEIGMSINTPDGFPVGAVSVAVSGERLGRGRIPSYIDPLTRTVRRIEQDLFGYTADY